MAGYDDRDGFIWMDGALVPWREANVHILTHALHYASRVFEGERCYNGKIFKSRAHSERLLESGRLLDMPIPWSVDQIEAAKAEVLKANDLTEAYRARRRLARRGRGHGRRLAQATRCGWRSRPGNGAPITAMRRCRARKLDIAKWKRPSPETIPTAAKAAGLYMICTMSKHAAEEKGCSDALFMDWRGYVAEATGANVFFVKDNEVHTPLADAILNGITRQTVIGMLRDMGIAVHERHILPEELSGFQQCWLTGTAAEITPVGQIGEYHFQVGDLTRNVAAAYEKLVRS
jgi:branched-chain amino acid aminotransferase